MTKESLNLLTAKVTELIQRYQTLCDTNEALKKDLMSKMAEAEAKSNYIAQLEDEINRQKDEGLELIKQVEAVLGEQGA